MRGGGVKCDGHERMRGDSRGCWEGGGAMSGGSDAGDREREDCCLGAEKRAGGGIQLEAGWPDAEVHKNRAKIEI